MSAGGARLFAGEDLAAPESVRIAERVAWVHTEGAPHREAGENQDAAAVLPVGPGRGLLAVADGVGGGTGGARAAVDTLAAIWDAANALAPDSPTLRSAVLDGVERANAALQGGGAATLVVAEIDGATVRPYHVGDAALWIVGQRGRVKLQTIEHSPVGYMVEAGFLDEGEALHHEERHIVSNAVGTDDMRIEIGSPVTLAPRDTVLLGSDGLFDNLSQPEIVDTIRSGPLERAAASLVRMARARMEDPAPGDPSKSDDLSFILLRGA